MDPAPSSGLLPFAPLAGLLLLAGCAPGAIEWLPFPGDGSAASMILAVERGNDLRLFAVSLDPRPSSIELPIAFEDEPARLTALMLSEPLESLQLSPGFLEPEPEPNQRIQDLSFTSFTTPIHGGDVGAWSGGGVSQAILEFTIPRRSGSEGCADFEQVQVTRHRRTTRHFALPLDDGSVLAGYSNTVAHIVADGTIAEIASLARSRAATRTSTSIFVVADRLYRVELAPLRFDPVADIPAEVSAPDWLAGGLKDQIFSFANDGAFGYFDGRSWRSIEQLPITGENVASGGALWLGDGHGAALNPSSPSIARWDGELHHDVVDANALGFGAATTSSSYGPTAIDTRFGQLFRFEVSRGWTLIPIMNGPAQVQALTEYRGGFAWGTEAGTIGYATEEMSCGMGAVPEASEVVELTRLGDGLLVGYDDRLNDYRLVLFRPR